MLALPGNKSISADEMYAHYTVSQKRTNAETAG